MDMFGKGSGYRWLDAYIMAWLVELGTDSFCAKYLDFRKRDKAPFWGCTNYPGCRETKPCHAGTA
jgi:hypothetical protein